MAQGRSTHGWTANSLALLLALLSATDAFSQQAVLEEVIVTAQKRTESIRDVPIAVSVLSGEQMQEAGIKSINDMARFLPNVSLNDGSSSLYVRGIGTPELNPLGEQAVAYIIDGVYLPKYSYLKAGFLDIERIEVLKGPQGTLFGRNATAGVINIVNARPTEDWQASISYIDGDRDIRDAELAISGPITDKLKFRIAGRDRSEVGATISTTDNDTLGDRDLKSYRLSLLYDISESLSISASYTDFDFYIGDFGNNEFHVYPDDLRAVFGTADPNLEARLDRRTSLPRHKDNGMDKRSTGAGSVLPIEINWQYKDYQLTLVSAFAQVDEFLGGDTDMTALDVANTIADIQDSQKSFELRVSSPILEFGFLPGNFDFIAGLYYLDGDAEALIQVPLFADFANLVLATGAPPLLTNLLQSLSGPTPPVLDTLQGDFELGVKSEGIFGQVKWAITDSVSLTLGARKSVDRKTIDLEVTNSGPLPIWNQVTDSPFSVNKTNTFRDFSPKISASWDFIEEATAYITVAQGFRAGSFNAGATEEGNVEFAAESSDTLEAGVKSELFNNRLRANLSVFQTDYKDYQISTFAGLGYVTKNAPAVESRGAELDLTMALSSQLTVSAAVGYLDAKYTEHSNGACHTPPFSEQSEEDIQSGRFFLPRDGCDLTGKGLHRAPRWTGSAAFDYSLDMSPYGLPVQIVLGGDLTYRDEELFDSDLDPIDFEDDYILYNARIGVWSSNSQWRLDFHGKNLSDELVKVFSGDSAAQPGAHAANTNKPKYYFATLSYKY